jgi:hypothetical protein
MKRVVEAIVAVAGFLLVAACGAEPRANETGPQGAGVSTNAMAAPQTEGAQARRGGGAINANDMANGGQSPNTNPSRDEIVADEVRQAVSTPAREPRNVRELRAFCATRRNVPSQGEGGGDFLPFNVPHTWRCKDARVLVCAMGASGRACMHEMEVDAERMAAFREWCAERPNGNIPYSLSTGLHSTWECRGTRPVMVDRGSVDRDGYIRGAWRPL